MKLKSKGRRIVQRVPPDCSARSPQPRSLYPSTEMTALKQWSDWVSIPWLSGHCCPENWGIWYTTATGKCLFTSTSEKGMSFFGRVPSWTEVWYGFKTGIKILLICRRMAKSKGGAIFPEISFLQIKKSSPSKILSYSSASYFLQGNSSKMDLHKPFYLLCKC